MTLMPILPKTPKIEKERGIGKVVMIGEEREREPRRGLERKSSSKRRE